MKLIFNWLLIIFLMISCKHSAEHHELTSETNKEADPIVSRTLVAPQKFDEMPPLANYVNELLFWLNDRDDTSAFITLEDSYIALAKKDNYYDFLNIDTFASDFASFSASSYGTGYSHDWTTTYSLLDDSNEPIVLITRIFGEFSRISLSERQEQTAEFENELAEQGIEESKIATIIENMTNREFMNPCINLTNDDNSSKIAFWVWQKKASRWQNITTKVFAPTMIQELSTHFPFVSLDNEPIPMDYSNSKETINGIYIQTHCTEESVLKANKPNWQTWFGITQLKDLKLQIELNGADILMRLSKNKTIKWEWDGLKYTLKDLPAKVVWVDNACPSINFKTGGNYTFKGKIGDVHDIEMQVKVTPQKGKILMQGNYWYSNQVDSKFPVSGDLSNNVGSFTFYRIKAGQNRESFDGYFEGCKITGWWQHLGNKDILPFYLELQ